MARKLTTEQEQAKLERLALAAAPVEATDTEAVEAGSLEVALGRDEPVMLGDRTVLVAMLRLKDVKRGYELINACPPLLTGQVLATKEGKPLTLAALTATINYLTANDEDPKPPLTEDIIADALQDYPTRLAGDEKAMNTMLDLALLVLKRRQPQITRAEIEDEFDCAFFLDFFRALLRVQSGLRDAF